MSSTTQKCADMLCHRNGVLKCSRCKGADPETFYCSPECQKSDWRWHKKFCGKQAYVFDVELLGSSNPKITRKVAVPSWYTFKQFHFVLQYIFGPWQNCHLHTFSFLKELGNQRIRSDFSIRKEILLELCHEGDVEYVSQNWFDEREVKLSDVYEEDGRLRSKIMVNGNFAPLLYEYDFGDGWEHKITFVKSELARAARPLVKEAVGCGPVEDSGGIQGWNKVKEAFAATQPTTEQLERRQWAREVSGLEERYNPLAEPDVIVMNYEGRWENHEEGYREDERRRTAF
ncbi:hypothetical protein M422DRAFT_268844 [Sphaerobolus stellatus SS14]|uniref:MYND-type domain-containing protein n=1 Tax=Sphaerobolus stellatus (strain SS14) TaxID=990650 RepID=A0A0C9UWL8_SPHS4|nr:hypothetical protein M422DRAFT_268844 [Sphaerobolus stellatus SS14]